MANLLCHLESDQRQFGYPTRVTKFDPWYHPTPAHLLRDVFEQELDFASARRRLIESPIATPVIFSLAGTRSDELCIIERTEEDAHVHDGASAAANAWQAPGWFGRERGIDSAGRANQMMSDVVQSCAEPASGEPLCGQLDRDFNWLKPPILNDHTRLVMNCDAARGELIAQGYEADGPATQVLELRL